MFGIGNSQEVDEQEYTDIVGQHLESFIAVFIRSIGKLNNFAVGNMLSIGGEKYAYQFNLHREGTQGFREIHSKFQEAQQ